MTNLLKRSRAMFLLFLAMLIQTTNAKSQAANDPKLAITHLTGDLYVYTTYNFWGEKLYPSNSMYLVTNDGVVLFDTPWDTTRCQPLLDSIARRHNRKVILSISTHYHADRTAGLDFFRQQGVRTYSSKQTLELCKTHSEEKAEYVFTKDTVFRVGQYTFQTFYPGEGHTSDNIVIWFEKDKTLYGACFIKSTESTGLGNIADANVAAWPASIENLKRKFPAIKYVIPGHGGWDGNKALLHTQKLLQRN